MQATAWRAGSSPVLPDSPPRRRRWMARVFTVVVVGALLAIAYLGGPRGWFGTAVADDPHSPGTLADDPSPPPGLEEAAAPLGSPPPVPDGGTGKYRFLNTTNGSDPVTFSPCRPIHYVVRPTTRPRVGRR